MCRAPARRYPEKPDIRYHEPSAELPALQRAILAQQAEYVRPGGVLLYSTCTILRRENEAVAEDFLRTHPDFVPENAPWPEAPASRRERWSRCFRGSMRQTASLSANSGGNLERHQIHDAGGAGDELKALGEPAFRAKQIYRWMHRGVRDFSEMTDISRTCASGSRPELSPSFRRRSRGGCSRRRTEPSNTSGA